MMMTNNILLIFDIEVTVSREVTKTQTSVARIPKNNQNKSTHELNITIQTKIKTKNAHYIVGILAGVAVTCEIIAAF